METTTVVPGESESTDAPRGTDDCSEEGKHELRQKVRLRHLQKRLPQRKRRQKKQRMLQEATEEKLQGLQEDRCTEPEAAEPEAATGEPVASIIRHYAPVADNEGR